MRTLSAEVKINEETFVPGLKLLLDGKDSGVSMAMEAVQDMKELHGPEVVRIIIDTVIQQLNEKNDLTADEIAHYQENFETLIQPKTADNLLWPAP